MMNTYSPDRGDVPFQPPEKYNFRIPDVPALTSITQVTPEHGFYVHTYYDVCPFSPSGRYLVCSRLPGQERAPVFGDSADVCVIDLHEQTIRAVYSTVCWGHQTGTMAQWGATDRYVYTNNVIQKRAVCVRIDLETGETRPFQGPLYHISQDESDFIGFSLDYFDITQRGYGMPSREYDNPPVLPPGASETEGIWRTEIPEGKTSLVLSLADAAARIPVPPPAPDGTFYFWHSKFNPQGTRMMVVLRCLFPDGSGGRNVNVFTSKPDGSDLIRTYSEPVWGHGGGHPNWHPDGRHLLRNLQPDGSNTRFCKVPVDGSEPLVLTQKIDGGGHPTMEPGGRYVVTDAMYMENGPKVRIRIIDVQGQSEEAVCVMPTMPLARQVSPYAELRLDGHPAWDRDFSRICFQAAPHGRRQLFVADMRPLIGSAEE